MISEALLTLPQMLAQMDIALVDEIKAQSRKSGTHVAVNGIFVAEQSRQYLYTFTLLDPWEPQDDTPLKSNLAVLKKFRE